MGESSAASVTTVATGPVNTIEGLAAVTSGPPWHKPYSVAAFAAEAVVRLLDPTVALSLSPYGSQAAKALYRRRRAFTAPWGQAAAREEMCFAGAVLAKIAQRGFPAPCSLQLERELLRQAQAVGLLRFRESVRSGTINFHVLPPADGLREMLIACFFPELLLDERQAQEMLGLHRGIASPPEREFLDLFVAQVDDPRLALLLTPQRLLSTMVRPTARQEQVEAGPLEGRADFAVELPGLATGNDWLQIAIEIDDVSHVERAEADRQRDAVLASHGWRTIRLSTSASRRRWAEAARQIAQMLTESLTDRVIEAARAIRGLPIEQKHALQGLVNLPIAEAQLLTVMARRLRTLGSATFTVASPDGLDLSPVLEALDGWLTALERLYQLPPLGRPMQANGVEEAEVVYLQSPSPEGWVEAPGRVVVGPTLAFADYEEPLSGDALPRDASEAALAGGQEGDDVLLHFLRNIFRKEEFREGQREILQRALARRHTLGLLPTAAGKSLCYQLASMLQPGFTLVVEPLRSLMWDQMDNLDAMGIHRCAAIVGFGELTGEEEQRTQEEGYRAIEYGYRFFVFISPERFQVPRFRLQIKSFAARLPIPYCVVDEAHCVSEWGHDFRPAYLNLGWLVPSYCEHLGQTPTFIALTGTASQNVVTDILRELEIRDPDAAVLPRSFDRSELSFEVRPVRANERCQVLSSLVRGLLGYTPGMPPVDVAGGLVFTYFVNDVLGAAEIYQRLRRDMPELASKIGIYTGDRPKTFAGRASEWEKRKIETQKRFKANELAVVVCTHSFGMGIDKPDIRFTVHAMLPRSLEEFYQQAGRAGRDGSPARCIVLVCDDHPSLADEVLDPRRVPVEAIESRLGGISRPDMSDALLNTWFLRNNFLGLEREKEILDSVWGYLKRHLPARENDRARVQVPFDYLRKQQHKLEQGGGEPGVSMVEKAVYRLLVVGAVEDYAKDWARKVFEVTLLRRSRDALRARFVAYLRRYATEGEVRRYLPEEPAQYEESVRLYAHRVIDFVYDRIESRRRRAMWEMLRTTRDAIREGDRRFREELLRYLEESEFTEPVRTLSETNWENWFELVRRAEGVDGLRKLYGACRRQLEESPNHPGLLLLNGICRLEYGDDALEDVAAAIQIVCADYPDLDALAIAGRLLGFVRERFPGKADSVLAAILDGVLQGSRRDGLLRSVARLCYKESTPYSEAYTRAFFVLLDLLLKSVREEAVP